MTPSEPKHNGCIAILTFTLLPQVPGTVFKKSYMVTFAAHKPWNIWHHKLWLSHEETDTERWRDLGKVTWCLTRKPHSTVCLAQHIPAIPGCAWNRFHSCTEPHSAVLSVLPSLWGRGSEWVCKEWVRKYMLLVWAPMLRTPMPQTQGLPETRLRETTSHSLLLLVVANQQKVSASASSSRMIAPYGDTPLLKSANPAAPCSAHK